MQHTTGQSSAYSSSFLLRRVQTDTSRGFFLTIRSQEEEGEQYQIGRVFKSFREMAGEKPKTGNVWNTVKPFVNGGASGMLATCVIQPVDMIKVFALCLPVMLIFLVFFFLAYFQIRWGRRSNLHPKLHFCIFGSSQIQLNIIWIHNFMRVH